MNKTAKKATPAGKKLAELKEKKDIIKQAPGAAGAEAARKQQAETRAERRKRLRAERQAASLSASNLIAASLPSTVIAPDIRVPDSAFQRVTLALSLNSQVTDNLRIRGHAEAEQARLLCLQMAGGAETDAHQQRLLALTYADIIRLEADPDNTFTMRKCIFVKLAARLGDALNCEHRFQGLKEAQMLTNLIGALGEIWFTAKLSELAAEAKDTGVSNERQQ